MPTKLPFLLGDTGPHLIHDFLVPVESISIWHLDQFGRFVRLVVVTRHTNTQTSAASVHFGVTTKPRMYRVTSTMD